jgi:hypothetical protein
MPFICSSAAATTAAGLAQKRLGFQVAYTYTSHMADPYSTTEVIAVSEHYRVAT